MGDVSSLVAGARVTSSAAAEVAVSSEAKSSLEAAVPIAAALIPATVIVAQSELAMHIAGLSIPEAPSASVDTKVSLRVLLQKVDKEYSFTANYAKGMEIKDKK